MSFTDILWAIALPFAISASMLSIIRTSRKRLWIGLFLVGAIFQFAGAAVARSIPLGLLEMYFVCLNAYGFVGTFKKETPREPETAEVSDTSKQALLTFKSSAAHVVAKFLAQKATGDAPTDRSRQEAYRKLLVGIPLSVSTHPTFGSMLKPADKDDLIVGYLA